MYVKTYNYRYFDLIAFNDRTPINFVVIKDWTYFIQKIPLETKSGIIQPKDEIVGLLCNKTSGGFGSLHLKEGFLYYLGKVKFPEETLVLFSEKIGEIEYGYIEIGKGDLFFLNYSGSGRIIEVDKILRYKKPQYKGLFFI